MSIPYFFFFFLDSFYFSADLVHALEETKLKSVLKSIQDLQLLNLEIFRSMFNTLLTGKKWIITIKYKYIYNLVP